MIADPDEGLDLRDDVKHLLQTSISSYQSGKLGTLSAEQVAENLDLEW
jgi:hypothetical protein